MTRQFDDVLDFRARYKDIIIKPLYGNGGAAVFRIKPDDGNLASLVELFQTVFREPFMVQEFRPEVKDGDKRILMIDGEPVPYCLARIPAAGETRGNLAAGGRGEARPLTERDREIAAAVGPTLREKGLIFVGLDVIGDHLTEINVTSPTCIREIDAAFDTRIGERLMDCIARKRGLKA